MKIYTRTGDSGETSLFGGRRVSKKDLRIEAYGTVDELNTFLGLARASWTASPIDGQLEKVQADLFDIGADLASPDSSRFKGVPPTRVEELEHEIDRMETELTPLKTFILPGGSLPASHLHVARAVYRRAERMMVALGDTTTTLAYLNRLADYLFVAARLANKRNGVPDTPWSGR